MPHQTEQILLQELIRQVQVVHQAQQVQGAQQVHQLQVQEQTLVIGKHILSLHNIPQEVVQHLQGVQQQIGVQHLQGQQQAQPIEVHLLQVAQEVAIPEQTQEDIHLQEAIQGKVLLQVDHQVQQGVRQVAAIEVVLLLHEAVQEVVALLLHEAVADQEAILLQGVVQVEVLQALQDHLRVQAEVVVVHLQGLLRLLVAQVEDKYYKLKLQ